MPTRWTDNDQYGHINNAVYYHYFDSVVNRYLIEHCKLDPSAIRINGGAPSNTDNNSSRSTRIFYVVSSNAKYHAAASYPDVLRLGMSIAKLGRSSVTYRIGVFAPLKNGHDTVRWRCAVTGEFVHVCVDAMTGRPLQIADDMRSALERVVSPDN
ncbi:HotDog domain-containing protein [Gaertneriomyces semiglobifer]|nr:HotDog domain-containing protein [Gaertneriomyces semiglobifer]